MGAETILMVLALGFGLYMAWNIGANDVGNAMGTSVGSRALTLKQAVIVATVMETAGALLVGSHVTNTVRKGITDPQLYAANPEILLYGMLAALLAAGVWLQVATYYGWPVSTTHSIVGAVVGFGVVGGGVASIHWAKVLSIAMSWVISPIMSGVVAFIVFTIIKKKVLNARDVMAATQRVAPIFVGLVFAVLTMILLFKGLKNLNLDMTLGESVTTATGIGFVTWLASAMSLKAIDINRFKRRFVLSQRRAHNANLEIADALRKAYKRIRKKFGIGSISVQMRLEMVQGEIKHLAEDIEDDAFIEARDLGGEDYFFAERIFGYLQILSAIFVAFAHGANDVANAIGPLAAIYSILSTHQVAMQVDVPIWLLLLGGFGISLGLATWGWRVIETIGKKLTELTPSRGFAAEFSAATVIAIASKMGIPVSTTHTLVGAVIGVGIARGMASLNLGIVRNIVIGWFITVPMGAVLAIIFFYIIKAIFG